MNKQLFLMGASSVFMLIASFGLTGCNGNLSSETSFVSSQIATSSGSNAVSSESSGSEVSVVESSISSETDEVSVSELLFNLKNNKLIVNTDEFTDYKGEGYEDFDMLTHIYQFYGETSASAFEIDDETGEVYIDEEFFKDDQGNLETRYISTDNTLVAQDYTIEDDNGNAMTIPYDLVYGNIFANIDEEDFAVNNDGLTYTLTGEDGLLALQSLTYYGGEIVSCKLTIDDADTLSFEIVMAEVEGQSETYSYQKTYTGYVTTTDQDELKCEPYATEDYHEEIKSALDGMKAADSFTYDRTKYLESEPNTKYEINNIKVTKDKIYAPEDGLFGFPEGGYAVIDDYWYSYVIEDGKVGSLEKLFATSEATLVPSFEHIAPEVFEKVSDGVYKARTPSIAYGCLYYMLEGSENVAAFSNFIPNGDLTIYVEDGVLTKFDYTLGYDPYGLGMIFDVVHVSTTVKDINSTTIDFEVSLPSVNEWFAGYIGTFEGSLFNQETQTFDAFTMVINSESDITLNGVSVTNINIDSTEKIMTFMYNGISCTIRFQNDSWDGNYLYLEIPGYTPNSLYSA